MAHHVNRNAGLGTEVLISEPWYNETCARLAGLGRMSAAFGRVDDIWHLFGMIRRLTHGATQSSSRGGQIPGAAHAVTMVSRRQLRRRL